MFLGAAQTCACLLRSWSAVHRHICAALQQRVCRGCALAARLGQCAWSTAIANILTLLLA